MKNRKNKKTTKAKPNKPTLKATFIAFLREVDDHGLEYAVENNGDDLAEVSSDFQELRGDYLRAAVTLDAWLGQVRDENPDWFDEENE